ncbi:MAG TPA: hypothetical protein VFE26_10875 [Trebonia sp.]|jgi:hypothetical protein|nr:hypothetical protein [Trebonia sp.]
MNGGGRLVKGLVNEDAATDAELDVLMTQARGMRTTLDEATLDRLGDLARRIMADQVRRAGGVLPAHLQRTYRAMSDAERQGSRSAVHNVVCALILLGFIDQSGA